MISQSKNRVQAIKSKFENLNSETQLKTSQTVQAKVHVSKQYSDSACDKYVTGNFDKENDYSGSNHEEKDSDSISSDEWAPKPNTSYLYHKNDVKRSLSESKKSLCRQSSDPGKKLHRSHAFRCDRSQKIVSPKRHLSCNGRSETSNFTVKMEKKLSKDRLKRLGNLLEDHMRKENFVPVKDNEVIVGEVQEVIGPSVHVSVPDSDVPKHILDQYAKVVKRKKEDDGFERREVEKKDGMTDSGVSSETENLEEEKTGRIKKLMGQFEKTDDAEVLKRNSNLESMLDLCTSSDTIRLEKKNPHLTLTDTLKKALKQPLPAGPPPKKPPRSYVPSIPESPERQKKDTKKMLQKLEQVLMKREAATNPVKNDYDIVENNCTTDKHDYDIVEAGPVVPTTKQPKEIHYLCTEILDITQRTLLPNQNTSIPSNCFKSLNCAITNSTMSLPYTRLSSFESNSNKLRCCSCSNDNLANERRLSTFLTEYRCEKCLLNDKNAGFKCHLNCKCKDEKSKFFVDNEHIYDEPFNGDVGTATIGRTVGKKINHYGTLNQSKSLEDLRNSGPEDQKIYDIPCEVSRPATPEESESPPAPLASSPPAASSSPPVASSSPPNPDDHPKGEMTEFEKRRQLFEQGFSTEADPRIPDARTHDSRAPRSSKDLETMKYATEKPPMKPKPIFAKKLSRSIENIVEEDKKKPVLKPEASKYRRSAGSGVRMSLKKDSTQLDVDRENLTRLMNEIYETVSAANGMDENKPGGFPTDAGNSEESVKLTRSLTEKRKNYVRRVCSRVAYLEPKKIKPTRYRHQTSVCSFKSEIVDNPYPTFRSWKSFRTSQNNLAKMDSSDSKTNLTDGDLMSVSNEFDSSDSVDKLSIDEKTGCVDLDLPFERDRALFNVCLLVGLDYMQGKAYVKSVFPSQFKVPPHIESLVFPETISGAVRGGEWADAGSAQCYSLVLTDERGERLYGYCRRVLPEGATVCLPLCYCLIGKYRAPGFYYKVLQEIESHHGSSEVEIQSILQQLLETDFPYPGEEITITYTNCLSEQSSRNSINLGDLAKCKTLSDFRHRSCEVYSEARVSSDNCDNSDSVSDKLPAFYDLENNNGPRKVMLSMDGERTRTLKRPLEPRIEESSLSTLVQVLGAGLTVKVFGALLLERKVLVVGDRLSQVSACIEALQSALYPLVWQHTLIAAVPGALRRDVLDAPLPLLAGVLALDQLDVGDGGEESLLIDLSSQSKLVVYQGDEQTILPASSYKTLKTSLQMESRQNEDPGLRNVMISEAFLRFFVDIIGDYWRFFSIGEVKEDNLGSGDVSFDKEAFIKSATSKQNQYFLEWFTETAMFSHFIKNMAILHHERHVTATTSDVTSATSVDVSTSSTDLLDTPLPDFYRLFEERVQKRRSNGGNKCVDGKSNYKNAVNRRVKLLKAKLRELVT